MAKEYAYLTGDEEEDTEILQGASGHGWKWIKDWTTSVDRDKGIEDKAMILQRESDGKFFRFEWSENNYHSLYSDGLANSQPIRGEEVIKKTVTKTVYE